MFGMLIATLAGMVFTTVISGSMAAPAANASSPGQTLIDTGKDLNMPGLELTGKVINDLARDLRSEIRDFCRLHPCSLWSKWSECNHDIAAEYGYFGGQNRTRNCGFNSTICKRYADLNLEYDFRLCKGCRDSYTVTTHGYCIKYFPISLHREAAVAECHGDGGHLINIGSARKMKDVNDTLQTISATSFWVDGRRNQQNDEWEFETVAEDPSFSYWWSGQPGNNLCKIHGYLSSNGKNKWYWCGSECSTKRPFMCEIFTV